MLCNEQFLLFPQCFLLNQIIVSPFVHIFDIISLFAAELEDPDIGISGKGLTLYHTMMTFDDWRIKPFENIVGKEENAGIQHFLLFPQCFLSYERQL